MQGFTLEIKNMDVPLTAFSIHMLPNSPSPYFGVGIIERAFQILASPFS